jgi:hypothetical protein
MLNSSELGRATVLSTQYAVLSDQRAIHRYLLHPPLLLFSTPFPLYQRMHCKRLSLPVGQTFPKVLHREPSILDVRYWSKGGPRPRLRPCWRVRGPQISPADNWPPRIDHGFFLPIHDSLHAAFCRGTFDCDLDRCRELPGRYSGLALRWRVEGCRLKSTIFRRGARFIRQAVVR